MLELVRRGQAWVKLSGAYRLTAQQYPYNDVRPFADALLKAAPARLVWGTDWPHTACRVRMPNDGQLVELLHDWVRDRDVFRAILVDNPAKLYNFAAS
jgi:predicted TIM-barrel fold metal-dependent hydrolase